MAFIIGTQTSDTERHSLLMSVFLGAQSAELCDVHVERMILRPPPKKDGYLLFKTRNKK